MESDLSPHSRGDTPALAMGLGGQCLPKTSLSMWGGHVGPCRGGYPTSLPSQVRLGEAPHFALHLGVGVAPGGACLC